MQQAQRAYKCEWAARQICRWCTTCLLYNNLRVNLPRCPPYGLPRAGSILRYCMCIRLLSQSWQKALGCSLNCVYTSLATVVASMRKIKRTLTALGELGQPLQLKQDCGTLVSTSAGGRSCPFSSYLDCAAG